MFWSQTSATVLPLLNVFLILTVVAFSAVHFPNKLWITRKSLKAFLGKIIHNQGTCKKKSCSNLDFLGFFLNAESRTNQLSLDSHRQKSHLEVKKPILPDVVEAEGLPTLR